MLFKSWLRSAHASRTTDGQRRLPRLAVELLEDRSVPASGLSATMVADILPGTASSDPRDFASINGTLYFSAQDPTGEQWVYRSDGTAAGTTFLKTVGPLGTWAHDFTAIGSTVYFSAGANLWKTDGSRGGTKPIARVHPYDLTAMGGHLYFYGIGSAGAELYVSNGTKNGTKLLKDIDPGTHTEGGGPTGEPPYQAPDNSSPGGFVVLNNTLLFAAGDGVHGRELWRTDGTSQGTVLVKDLGPGDSNPRYLTGMNGAVYFAATSGLWKTDGTTAGTILLRSSSNGFSGGITGLTAVNGTIYFAATDATAGSGLWKSDGTAAGTVLVKNISASNLANAGGRLFFTGSAASDSELWTSNGSDAGTVQVKDINPGSASSNPGSLTNVNGLLYFAADDGVTGRELWQSDGTEVGTVMVRDIYVGNTSSNPAFLVAMNNKLYFAATDAEHGRELWDPPPVEPAQGYLLVADLGGDEVLRYDGSAGTFVDTIVPKHSGGMNQPWSVLIGPHDGNIYVSTGWHSGPGQLKGVLRYDGVTGAFIDEFAKGGDLIEPLGMIFGPDGNLYVATGTRGFGGRVERYDGRTGAFLGDFVTTKSGGLAGPRAMVFGPSGRGAGLDLYVSSGHTNSILRYDGMTGEFRGAFVAPGSGGLDEPVGLTFGPDGDLYVASSSYGSDGPREVLRFQGPSGTSPGTFVEAFLPGGTGGLQTPSGLLFGPDGNGDGQQDLYVSDAEYPGGPDVMGKNSTVKRYDGVTGAFIDTFVTANSGGLDEALLMTFTQTDPVTLAYTGGRLTAAATAPDSVNETLRADQAQPLLAEALGRWSDAGVDTSALHGLDIRIADIGGATLGRVIGNTIWLDDNAAGWGWFVDETPWEDAEFLLPGDQGEQGRMDLLTVLEHEIGHVLGHEHDADGVMQESLVAGTRRTVRPVAAADTVWLDEAVLVFLAPDEETPRLSSDLSGKGRKWK